MWSYLDELSGSPCDKSDSSSHTVEPDERGAPCSSAGETTSADALLLKPPKRSFESREVHLSLGDDTAPVTCVSIGAPIEPHAFAGAESTGLCDPTGDDTADVTCVLTGAQVETPASVVAV